MHETGDKRPQMLANFRRAPFGARAGSRGRDRMATALKDEHEFGVGDVRRPGATRDRPPARRPQPADDYMCAAHLSYFRTKLLAWRDDILSESRLTLNQLQADSLLQPDMSDRASSETDWGLELRTRDRQRKLIAKINAALRRIETGDYGYCEVTGEPISYARLEARPIATMTVEAQSRHERHEKISRDD